ncbi:MAG: LamG-like jellyroll fold domain-containing protein [Gemmataceae bacterium]
MNRSPRSRPHARTAGVAVALVVLLLLPAAGRAAEIPLVDKTLVAWVTPATLDQRGGSVLTIEDDAARFDAIVYGEVAPARWMAGSDFFRRTLRKQDALPAETADAKTLVQIAIAYRGPEVIVYRNGVEYARHAIGQPQVFDEGCLVVIGPRHSGQEQCFAGEVADARIYASALSGEQIAALKPKVQGAFQPWAWWTFDDAFAMDRTGRLPHTRLTGGAVVRGGRLVLNGKGATFTAARRQHDAGSPVLNYHLMHPGGESLPGDPNAAYYLDGVYHLHYILAHPWKDRRSFSFVHVTSPDMLHWTWQPTKLQPAFTGHGMFSGTGFLTKDGRPAAIYHGEGSGRNQIAIARDRRLSAWEKPFPVDVRNADGSETKMNHWDPDCFVIGDTYYALSGGEDPPLLKSKNLKTWTRVGPFLRRDLPDVARGEDVSCPNFFQLGKKWMLLCISHPLGCRYYLGDWDAKAEQFVPQTHGRMNWRRDGQTLWGPPWRVDFFAPESLLTPDGRRVMWAWCATLDSHGGRMSGKTIQSLPRELSLPDDGILRIKPLRELASLRYDRVTMNNVEVKELTREVHARGGPPGTKIAELKSDATEIRLVVPRAQAERKLFGVTLFADGKGGGLPVLLRPETGTLRVGDTEAPFAVADLPPGEDVELRIFVDRYMVEVFANDRQAVVAAHRDYAGRPDVTAFTVGAPTTFKTVELWKLKATNQGFLAAQKSRVWEPATK